MDLTPEMAATPLVPFKGWHYKVWAHPEYSYYVYRVMRGDGEWYANGGGFGMSFDTARLNAERRISRQIKKSG
jgi:hypothetical protein